MRGLNSFSSDVDEFRGNWSRRRDLSRHHHQPPDLQTGRCNLMIEKAVDLLDRWHRKGHGSEEPVYGFLLSGERR
jgi:hypothetical protein